MHYQYFIIAFLFNQMPTKILVDQSTSMKNVHTGAKTIAYSSWPYDFNICFPLQSSANENITDPRAVERELDLWTILWQDGFMLISPQNNIKFTPMRSASCLGRGGINQGTLPEFERFL